MKPSLLYCHVMRVHPEWRAIAHAHRFAELLILLKGGLSIVVNGQSYSAESGHMACFPAGVIHQEKSIGTAAGAEFYCIGIIDMDLDKIPVIVPDRRHRCRILARWITEELAISKSGANVMTGMLAYELGEQSMQPIDSPIIRIREYMREHCAEPLTLDGLARIAGISKYHLIRTYRAVTGKTPVDDIRRFRIEQAVRLMLSTDMPMKAIARETGFHDMAYFSRVFRQYQRMTPGAFREHR